jgi:hypothetical protein
MVDEKFKMYERDPVTGKNKYIPGSWKKMFKMKWEVLLLVLVVVFTFYMYKASTSECMSYMQDPCTYCSAPGLIVSEQEPDFDAFYDNITNRLEEVNVTEIVLDEYKDK